MRHAALARHLARRFNEISRQADVLEACAYEDHLLGIRAGSAVFRGRAVEALRDAGDLRFLAARYASAAETARRLAARPVLSRPTEVTP